MPAYAFNIMKPHMLQMHLLRVLATWLSTLPNYIERDEASFQVHK